MARVRHQRVAAQIFREDALAGGDRLLLRHLAETELRPGRLRAFHDEGRRVGIELVGMRPDPAVLRFLEDESESVVEFLVGAEPDVFALADVGIGLEMVGKLGPDLGVEPVRCDHEIMRRGKRRDALRLGLEAQLDPEFPCALLQHAQEPPAPDAAEAVPGGESALAAIVHGNVVPIGEVAADRHGADRIVGGDVLQRLLRQDHAPAERVVRAIALDHGDVVGGVAQLGADREIEARRSAAEARNFHEVALQGQLQER
jgi:hypothetical protein